MKRRIFLRQNIYFLSLAGLFLGACTLAEPSPTNQSQLAVKTMKLESSAFEANGFIPPKYTCDRDNISPPLHWDEPPAGTHSLALICDDPDAPMGTFVHWVLYDLPPKTRQLAESVPVVAELPAGGVQGKNDFRKSGYGGPCPPSGTHRYFFKLYALDKKLELEPGAAKAQLLKAMEGHVLASAELVGRYARQR